LEIIKVPPIVNVILSCNNFSNYVFSVCNLLSHPQEPEPDASVSQRSGRFHAESQETIAQQFSRDLTPPTSEEGTHIASLFSSQVQVSESSPNRRPSTTPLPGTPERGAASVDCHLEIVTPSRIPEYSGVPDDFPLTPMGDVQVDDGGRENVSS